MLDLARLVVFFFVAWRCLRCRTSVSGPGLAVLMLALYLFAVEVTSGITVREAGPMVPVAAMILVFIGPSGLPRGALPSWLPFGGMHVRHSVLPEVAVIAALAVVSLVAHRRAAALPVSKEAQALDLERLHLGFALCAVLASFQLSARVVPLALGIDLVNARVDSTD